MKKCLWCQRIIEEEYVIEKILYNNDCLCSKCRNSFKIVNKKFDVNNLKVYALYEYNDFMSSVMIQYKECLDEILCDVFIDEQINYLKRKYKNCIFIMAPSSKNKFEQRGFNHVEKIFSKLGIEMIDGFEKIDNTKQMLLHKDERLLIKDKIKLKENLNLANKKIILIDDVCTTGATLDAMCEHLKDYNCCGALVIAINQIIVKENCRWTNFMIILNKIVESKKMSEKSSKSSIKVI